MAEMNLIARISGTAVMVSAQAPNSVMTAMIKMETDAPQRAELKLFPATEVNVRMEGMMSADHSGRRVLTPTPFPAFSV